MSKVANMEETVLIADAAKGAIKRASKRITKESKKLFGKDIVKELRVILEKTLPAQAVAAMTGGIIDGISQGKGQVVQIPIPVDCQFAIVTHLTSFYAENVIELFDGSDRKVYESVILRESWKLQRELATNDILPKEGMTVHDFVDMISERFILACFSVVEDIDSRNKNRRMRDKFETKMVPASRWFSRNLADTVVRTIVNS